MRKSKSYSKFLHGFIKMGCIIFSIFFMVGCSAFQIRYETEIKEVVPTGYKYVYIKGYEGSVDSYLIFFLSRRNIEDCTHTHINDPSKTLLVESSAEDGIVFPPTFFHDFNPIFYLLKTAEIKIYDYSNQKLYAIVKYERGMFRSYERKQELKLYDEFKKIFINYKLLVDPIEESY